MAFRSSSSAAGVGSVVCNKPAGIVAGDRLLAFTNARGIQPAAPTAPAGWSLLSAGYQHSNAIRVDTWIKTATGAEPATYTFTPTGEAFSIVVVIVCDSTGAAGAQLDAGRTNNQGNSTPNWPALTLTPARGPGTVYGIWCGSGGDAAFLTTPLPGAWVHCSSASVQQGGPSASDSCIKVGRLPYAAPAATGTATLVTDMGINFTASQQAIAEAAAAGFPPGYW